MITDQRLNVNCFLFRFCCLLFLKICTTHSKKLSESLFIVKSHYKIFSFALSTAHCVPISVKNFSSWKWKSSSTDFLLYFFWKKIEGNTWTLFLSLSAPLSIPFKTQLKKLKKVKRNNLQFNWKVVQTRKRAI